MEIRPTQGKMVEKLVELPNTKRMNDGGATGKCKWSENGVNKGGVLLQNFAKQVAGSRAAATSETIIY